MTRRSTVLFMLTILLCLSVGCSTTELDSRIDSIVESETQWRFPNSHATTLSQEEASSRLELLRANVLLETYNLSSRMNKDLQDNLLNDIQNISNCSPKLLAFIRILGAYGTPLQQIQSKICATCREDHEELIREVFNEGNFIGRYANVLLQPSKPE